MLGRELVRRPDDFGRARRRVAGELERRQVFLRMRLEVRRNRSAVRELRGGGCGRCSDRRGIAEKRQDADSERDDDQDRRRSAGAFARGLSGGGVLGRRIGFGG